MTATEPPADAPLLPLDRRALLKGGLLGAGLAAAPLSAQIAERGFTSGVASGEPGAELGPSMDTLRWGRRRRSCAGKSPIHWISPRS